LVFGSQGITYLATARYRQLASKVLRAIDCKIDYLSGGSKTGSASIAAAICFGNSDTKADLTSAGSDSICERNASLSSLGSCLLDRAHVASKKHTYRLALDIESSALKYKYIVLLYIGWVKLDLVCR
jgi:hypothetical protein